MKIVFSVQKLHYCFWLLCFSHLCLGQGKVDIQAGAHIKIEGAVYLTCADTRLINNGTLNPGESVIIFENSLNQDLVISGIYNDPFHQLRIDMGASEVALDADIDVEKAITFLSGQFELSNHEIALMPSALLINENKEHHVKGFNGGEISINSELNSPTNENPGNLGIAISTASNLGPTIIKRGHQTQDLTYGTSIARWFDIAPSNNTNLGATLRFFYLDHELENIPEEELEFWQFDNGVWVFIGSTDRNIQENWVEISGVNTFSRWTLAPSSPVFGRANSDHLSSLTSKDLSKEIHSKWTKDNGHLAIFPNPSSNVLNIHLSNLGEGKANLSILSSRGQFISSKSIYILPNDEEFTSAMDVSFLPSGIYVLVLTKDHNSTVVKFTKME